MLKDNITLEEFLEIRRAEDREDFREVWMAEGRAEGRAEGVEQGYLEVNRLNELLIQDHRFEDLKRATKDSSYQQQLLKEYGVLAE